MGIQKAIILNIFRAIEDQRNTRTLGIRLDGPGLKLGIRVHGVVLDETNVKAIAEIIAAELGLQVEDLTEPVQEPVPKPEPKRWYRNWRGL